MTQHICLERSRAFFFVVIVMLFLLAACAPAPAQPDPGIVELPDPTPVIFDTDLAHEDMFAGLFLMLHPNVDVQAITIVGTGEVHCTPGVTNALGLVQVAGGDDIPVACGSETPLAGDHEFPAAWRLGADTAYGVTLPDGDAPSALDAPELIARVAAESEEPVTIVAVGPLTNLAAALQLHAEIATEIAHIYIMGGAVDAPGNVGAGDSLAEWNIYIDPLAANLVLSAGVPVTMVPLDATGDVPMTRSFYEALGEAADTPAARLVHDLLTANLSSLGSPGFHFWDTLTAAIFTDDSLATFEDISLKVEEAEGPASGQTVRSPGGPEVRVAMSANRQGFEQLLITILNWSD